MEMGNIPSNPQTGGGLSGRSSVTDIGGYCSDDLDTFSLSRINDRPTTDTVDCNAVNQVGMTPFLSRTDVPSEKTESTSCQTGVSEPSNLRADSERNADWEEWYRILWKLRDLLA